MRIALSFLTMSTSNAGKKVKIFGGILRTVVLIMLVSQLFMQRWSNVLMIVLTLLLFAVPYLIEKLTKIDVPDTLEIIILSFVFASTILGEMSKFYDYFAFWDTGLHVLNGFLAGGVGFSMIFILNKNVKGMKLSPVFMALVIFSFSMTIGVLWEFLEYAADTFLAKDMQKDRIVHAINSFLLGENGAIKQIKDIKQTTIETSTGLVKIDGYLDIGIIDTMKDMFVNLIGALIFSVLGYFYAKSDEQKFKFVEQFMPTKEE